MTQAISLRGITHDYPTTDGHSVRALTNVSLEVGLNEFAVVVGPSGCGKSTVLRIIAGLVQPTSGSVRVFDYGLSGPREDVGMVFQSPTLLPWLDIISNVIFPIRHRGRRVTNEDLERANSLLDLVGLHGIAERYPDELSGGMQQRVGIARALLSDPDILLLDEPFSALDALTRDEMSFELEKIWMQRRTATLLITHSIPEAVLLADRILVMSARPGFVRETISVDLSRPRGPHTMREAAYQAICDHLRGQLTGHHGDR